MTAPHLRTDVTPVTIRRGQFWIPGDLVSTDAGTVQRGPLYVEWEAPVTVTQPYPLVLVHGGGGQGTDWKGTPDGRPGWADRFVAAGFAVYIVDRPGHGRSPWHPDVLGPVTPPMSYELFGRIFLGDADEQWGWGRNPGDPELDQALASAGWLPADFDTAHALDAERLATLLDSIGPAVLVTHSFSGPSGWKTAALRRELIAGIVAVEPMPAESVPPLHGLPVALVNGATGGEMADAAAAGLSASGAALTRLKLPELGIPGNGHGIMLEANSDAAIVPVIDWLDGLSE